MPAPRVFIFAGEASADALGAMVIDGLEARAGSVECWGVGGPAMRRRGFRSVQPMEDFTVLGLGQAVRSASRLDRMGGALIEQILAARPDAILTIDNKGFSMRFARRLKGRMTAVGWRAPILHLVAPTVWAWGGWRARGVARSVDHLLCLFPFEESYFTQHGINVTVTGHPAAERKRPSGKQARARLGLGNDGRVLVLLPGSRRREVRSLLPDMLKAAAIVREDEVGTAVLVAAAETVADEVAAVTAAAGITGIRLCPAAEMDSVLAAGDYGLICSGTVTLEAALAGLAGSVYYRPDLASRLFGNVMVDRSKVVLANTVAGKEVYPLFLNREFTPRTMAGLALEGLRSRRKLSGRALAEAVRAGDGFAANAAGAILSEIGMSGAGVRASRAS